MNLSQTDQSGFLPAARLIADRIARIIGGQMGISAENAVKMANNSIDPAQRFYPLEYDHASIILSQQFPHIQQGAWRQHLGNYMGYRLREMPICRHGFVIDPVTRQCVKEYVPPEIPEEVPVEPPEVVIEEKEEAKLSGITLLLVGLLAFLVLRGR